MIAQCPECGYIFEDKDGSKQVVFYRRTNCLKCPNCGRIVNTNTFDDEILADKKTSRNCHTDNTLASSPLEDAEKIVKSNRTAAGESQEELGDKRE